MNDKSRNNIMADLGVYTANRKIKHMIDNEIAQQTTKKPRSMSFGVLLRLLLITAPVI